ncbi:unnamed protein product [Pararhodospirillum photometricum DSM 122]|uniref:Uncharacterized protein n=1 Tax=Pararhodospirillum photometricum DSM 122 TaxID=1150469 RepID=H6SKS6_PARPM|nr:unnamed protein product [Pararhodospirillum photometricum DSM 122]
MLAFDIDLHAAVIGIPLEHSVALLLDDRIHKALEQMATLICSR